MQPRLHTVDQLRRWHCGGQRCLGLWFRRLSAVCCRGRHGALEYKPTSVNILGSCKRIGNLSRCRTSFCRCADMERPERRSAPSRTRRHGCLRAGCPWATSRRCCRRACSSGVGTSRSCRWSAPRPWPRRSTCSDISRRRTPQPISWLSTCAPTRSNRD